MEKNSEQDWVQRGESEAGSGEVVELTKFSVFDFMKNKGQ